MDRAAFPRDKACSEYMSPEAVRLLDRLGVVGALEAAGAAPLQGTTVTGARAAAGSTAGSPLAGAAAVPPDRALASPAGSSTMRWWARRARPGPRCWSARPSRSCCTTAARWPARSCAMPTALGASLRARLTVGADGLRSIVARRLGRRRHGHLRRIAFVAHVDGVAGMGDSAEMHVGRARVRRDSIAIGGGRTNVAAGGAGGPGRGGRGAGWRRSSSTRSRGFPGLRERVAAGALSRRVLATGPFAAWSGRVIADGAALVGDAADFFDPFTGEGIYSALRGAELLAETAAAALAEPGPVSAARPGALPAGAPAGLRRASGRSSG